MDTLIESEVAVIQEIADTNDYPVLMMNLNRYKPGCYPDGDLYKEWRKVNAEMIANVDGKILWSLPVEGQILVNGDLEPVDEILAYWYPSHQSFLNTRNYEITKRNFELRQELVDYAIIHRCSGENPPQIPG